MVSPPVDPEHYRTRAKEVRSLADEMKNEKSKQTMLRLAENYDHMAERAELYAQRPSLK